MRRKQSLCLLALALIAATSAVQAGTFQQLDLERLVGNSATALEGEVLGVESFWDSEGRIIVTEATIQVTDRVYGKADSVVRVKTFGGTVGDYTIDAPGFPTFQKGERLFLFLRQDERDAGMLRVTGYQQGQFRIVTGLDKMESAVSAVDGDALLVQTGVQGRLLPESLPLSELKSLVRLQAAVLSVELNEAH